MRKDVLILGDCLVELKKLGENTIDCVVTDPPYELGFMGKAWDNTGIAYKVALWQEVLRVLKPGGHLLAFGGSRTYHRMACAIEDAGFEIRDQIMWVYGCLSEDTEILTINGWERYHKTIDNNLVLCYNVDNNSYEFHKPKRSFIYENKHTAYRIHSDSTDQIVSRNHRVLVERGGKLIFQRAEELQPQENIPFLESLPDLSEAISDYNKRTSNQEQGLSELYQGENGEMEQREIQNTGNYLQGLWQKFQAKMEQNKNDKVLLSTMQWKDKGNKPNRLQVRQNRNEISGNGIEWRQKSCLEGRSNLFQEARELFANKICQMSERILGYGSQGRLCYGTQAHNGSISQAVFTENRGCSPHQPQSAGQSGRKSAAIYNEQRSQNPRRTRAEVTPIEYKGNVWCVEVETGAFVARRNGKIFITGNSGFPKSLSIGKAVDKLQGNERTKGELKFKGGTQLGVINDDSWKPKDVYSDKGHSDWEGYGTALKPAHEPIVWATKRLTNTMEYDILSMDRNLKENIWLSIERLQRLDISKLQATVSIHLNTVLLWHAILGELSQSENKSTTSTVSKAITELKILNSLLLRNTQESTDGKSPTSLNGIQECQADGSKLLVKVVDKILGEEKKSMPDILTLIAQELATYRQSKNGISVESAVSDLLPIILNVNSVLLRVLTDLLTERNNSELSIFVSIAEKCLKQYLAEPLNTATQDVWLSHINTLVNHKPIVLARKPLSEKTVAENCLKWGVGGLNIDGCRVGHNEPEWHTKRNPRQDDTTFNNKTCGFNSENTTLASANPSGRFPANFIHDGSDEVVELFPNTNPSKAANRGLQHSGRHGGLADIGGNIKDGTDTVRGHTDNGGSAARFFYCAKASKRERDMGCEGLEAKEMPHSTAMRCGNCGLPILCGTGQPTCKCEVKNEIRLKARNNHPTVKPIALMKYLVKLVSREGQTVLDPFAGSFTTGLACVALGRNFIGIEMEEEYFKIGQARMESFQESYGRIEATRG